MQQRDRKLTLPSAAQIRVSDHGTISAAKPAIITMIKSINNIISIPGKGAVQLCISRSCKALWVPSFFYLRKSLYIALLCSKCPSLLPVFAFVPESLPEWYSTTDLSGIRISGSYQVPKGWQTDWADSVPDRIGSTNLWSSIQTDSGVHHYSPLRSFSSDLFSWNRCTTQIWGHYL